MNAYPVRVEARLEEPLNRWLWLVKWVLAIPHYVLLAFLWVAFLALTVVAFFAILFTGRYPRALFEFDVGVLRWTWRVAYYTYGALGTDRYPPFTLGPAPDYPATLEIDYPERLSRGLVLVKWWLLAIPHYLVVGLFTSGSAVTWRGGLPDGGGVLYTLDWGGLIGLLVVVAALVLLFTGRYPRGVFDFVLGMNRWALRVAAYATLMTDEYPPFRLDLGGRESAERERPAVPPAVRHGAASILTLAVGAIFVFGGLAGATAGTGAAILAGGRDAAGFVSTGAERVTTPSHALVLDRIEVAGQGVGFLRRAVGRVRVEASGEGAQRFVGIASRADAERYLAGVSHDRIPVAVGRLADVDHESVPGGAPAGPPGAQPFWAARGSGQAVWDVRAGDWVIVVMNADGSPGVTADLAFSATLPWLASLSTGLYIAAVVLIAAGGVLVTAGIRMTT